MIFGNTFREASADYMDFLKGTGFKKSFLIIFLLGLAAGIYRGIASQSPLFLFLSDLFFTEFLFFFVVGTVHLLGNVHAFSSASYGFRFVHRLFRNQPVPGAGEAKDDFLAYRQSRPKHPQAGYELAAAGIFLLLSVAMIPLA